MPGFARTGEADQPLDESRRGRRFFGQSPKAVENARFAEQIGELLRFADEPGEWLLEPLREVSDLPHRRLQLLHALMWLHDLVVNGVGRLASGKVADEPDRADKPSWTVIQTPCTDQGAQLCLAFASGRHLS